MPTLQQLPLGLQAQITALFRTGNFCFLTSAAGRTPTFYFAQGGVAQLSRAHLCGRLRTMHGSGPLIDVTTSRKRHFFFQNRADRQTVNRVMRRTSRQQKTNGDARFFMDLVGQVYGTVPQNGRYHYEYTVSAEPNGVTRRHPSGGTVSLLPQPTQVHLGRLITRLLGDNCRIEVDGQPRGFPGPWINRVAVAGAAAYLASL